MNIRPEPVAEALSEWLSQSESSIRDLRPTLGADDFCDDYLGLLAAGQARTQNVAEKLVALVDGAFAQRVTLTSFLDDYNDAMSVSYHGKRVFLPSFSDSCLSELHPQSPFAGLHYCWSIGEAYYALRRGKTEEALSILTALEGQLDKRARKRTTTLTLNQQQLNTEIVRIKAMISDVIMKRKWGWTDAFPYPCRTSTHFYLSGIRFYWNPIVKGRWSSRPARRRSFDDSDRYSVQSTSSGLFSPSERYGYLVPTHATPKRRADAAIRLLDEVPIGSLALDLMDSAPTRDDLNAAHFYNRWSDLVAKATLPIVEETIADCEGVVEASIRKERNHLRAQAVQAFETRASKNPMRTFYFDCGLIASARRHAVAPTTTPHVQYVTTQASDPHADPMGLGIDMFQAVRRHCGDGLRVFAQRGEHFAHPDFPVWTLVPLGDGLRDARNLWSNRSSVTTPILHGFEGRVTRLLRHAIRTWGSELPRNIGPHGLMIALGSETYAKGDMSKEAITAATAFLLLCAAQNVVGPTRGARDVRSALRGVPGSDDYTQILKARDWNRLN